MSKYQEMQCIYERYCQIYEQNDNPLTQEQLTELYKKARPLQFIKNTPVALATVEQLSRSLGEEKTKEVLSLAGAVDKTSYDEAWRNKGYVVFQWNSNTKSPDIYIADPQTVNAKYTKFEGSLPLEEKAAMKIPSLVVLKHLEIDNSKLPFFVKKVATNMVSADELGIANQTILTSWGDQTVQSGGFLVREDNGHIYTVAPDQDGLPIGYIPATN